MGTRILQVWRIMGSACLLVLAATCMADTEETKSPVAGATNSAVSETGKEQLANILFSKVNGQIGSEDRLEIVSHISDLEVSPDGKSIIACDQTANAEVEVIDLNKDGVQEVFVVGGNFCTSGYTGSSLWLFIKDAAGVYRMNFGFPAIGYQIQKSKNLGFPDLMFGGPGFCFPIWQWNGKSYSFLKKHAELPGACDR